MRFENKLIIVSKVFAVVLALAMAVPVGMLFSSNAIAENTEMTTLTESTDIDTILLGETSINPPTSLQIDKTWDTPPPMSPFENIAFVDYENLTYVTDDNVSYEGPELPVFEHIEEPYNITLVTMNSPTGPLYEGKIKPIQVILMNKADHNIFDINVCIYDQLDDGEPVFLTDLFYGCIPKGKEQTKTFTWEPEAGTHYLTLNISYMDNGIEQWNEEEFGFYVMREIQENQNGNTEGSPDSYPGDPTLPWYIYGETIIQRNIITLDDGVLSFIPIENHQNNIIVTSTGYLEIIDTELPIICTSDGQYTITVENGGTLEILGDSLITAQNSDLTYGFEVYGTLNVLGIPTISPTIQWMYGDPLDETVPAGIQLYRSSAALFEYATIRDGKSHNIYADGAEFTVTSCDISGAQSLGIACGIYAINGAEMHVGGGTQVNKNGHSGIYSVVSSVDIDGVKVESNPEDGVSVIGDIEWQPGGWNIYGNNFEPWGKPVFTPGVDVGYYIWLDDIPEKNTWHIRWSGDGTGYSFNGYLTFDGDRTHINPVGSVEHMGFPDSTSIEFEDYEDSIEEGFDFRFDGSKIIFDIQILDGAGVQINPNIYMGEKGILPEFPYDQFRLYQMRPPVLHDFVISEVKLGLIMIGRSLGEVSKFYIQAGTSCGMYLYGIRQTQIFSGYVESESIENQVIFLNMNADYNILSDLNLVSCFNSGIDIRGSKYNNIQNVAVELLKPSVRIGFGFGLYLSGCNAFQSCEAKGFQYGFVVQFSGKTQITESTVTDCVYGIDIRGIYSKAAGVIVSSCTLKDNTAGIYALLQISLLIEDTIISENGRPNPSIYSYGIWIDEPMGAIIRNSYVSDNQDPDPGDISAGIVITGGDFGFADVTIEERTEIRGSDYGIYAYSCTNLEIRDSTIADNNIDGINVDSCAFTVIGNSIKRNGGIGVCLWNSNSNQINNIINDNTEAGIYCEQSSLIIRDNPSISNNGHGIWAKDSNPYIKNATIQYNEKAGIYLDNSNAEINRCNIRLNEYEGIKSVGDSNQIISDNDVWGNFLQGISITGGNATVVDNLIYNNRLGGMEVEDSPYYLSIRNNNITGNRWVFMDNSHIIGSAGLGIGLVNASANISSNRICGNLENIRLEGLVDTYISNNLLIQYVLPGAITPAVYRGVQATDSANLNISDNRFYVGSEPISIYDCEDVTIFNNTIKANGIERYTFRGVEYEESIFVGEVRYGVYSERSEALIIDNLISDCDFGIVSKDNSTLSIKANTLESNGKGIYILNARVGTNQYYAENETVHGPTFDGETGPIYLANGNIINCSMYADVLGEWIPMQEGADYTLNYATGEIDTSPIEPFEAGWYFHAYYNYSKGVSNNITNNIIKGNAEAGIYLEYSGNNEIIGNRISNNLYGVYVNGDSHNNSIYHNNIIDNTNQAYDGGIDNAWDNGPLGGNYWNDHICVGNPSDGSNPYAIPGGTSTDYYPFEDLDGWL